jgi:hypothetical protein
VQEPHSEATLLIQELDAVPGAAAWQATRAGAQAMTFAKIDALPELATT